MVDNTVTINDSCVGTDSPTLIIKQTIPETNFNPRNLLPANVADCTNTLQGISTSPISSYGTGVSVVSSTEDSLIGNRSIKCTTPGLSSEEGLLFQISLFLQIRSVLRLFGLKVLEI